MRISDWSSDACSSDLAPAHCRIFIRLVRLAQIGQRLVATDVERAEHHRPVAGRLQHIAIEPGLPLAAGKRCRDEELEFGPEKADPFGTRRVERAEVVPEEIGRAHVELQSLMSISYAVFCLKKTNNNIDDKDC